MAQRKVSLNRIISGMDVIRKEGCTAFGEGRQKKYFVEEVAEAFCRNAL